MALIVLVAALADLARRPRPAADRAGGQPWLLIAMGALVWMLLLSALFADDFQLQADMAFRRLATGIIVALLATRLLETPHDRRRVLMGFLAGASFAALVGLGQLTGAATELESVFWGRPTQFGAIKRLTLPYGHANIAGTHLGVAVVVGAALLQAESRPGPRRPAYERPSIAGATALCSIALSMTLSRSAVVAVIVVLIILGATSRRDGRSKARWPPIAIAGFLLALIGVNPHWHLRIEDPDPSYWYGVAIDAPPTVEPGDTVSITVTNQSNSHWSGSPTEFVEVTVRSDLPPSQFLLPALGPGESTIVPLEVDERPDHWLSVDVVRPGEGRFLRLTGSAPVTITTDTALVIDMAPTPRGPLPRRELWEAATTLAAERPVIGVGVGNFRLHYQRVVDRDGPQTSHAHSLVFEPLASWGIPAAVLFWGLIVSSVVRGNRRRADVTTTAGAAGLLAITFIGLTDWVISSATGGLGFWLLLGVINHRERAK